MLYLFFLLGFFELRGSIICDPKPGSPVTSPIGKARGINPGRVSWKYDGDACTWDGKTDWWWTNDYTDLDKVNGMVDSVVLSVSGETTLPKAWDAIFRHFNKEKSGKEEGYKNGEGVVVKLNLNTCVGYDEKSWRNANSVSPQFIKSLVRNLVNAAGVPQEDIVLYDATRWVQKYFYDPPIGIGGEFPNVKWVDAEGGMHYVDQVQRDDSVDFSFSSADVHAQKTSKLPTCLTKNKYLVQVNAFRGHDLAGITETGKNWFGSIWRPDILCNFTEKGLPGHWCPISLHQFVNISGFDIGMYDWLPQRPMNVYNPLVDLMGHDHTSHGKGLIFFSDGLYAGQAETGEPEWVNPLKFKMSPFNNGWTCSTFASLDPIALDSVLFDILREEPNMHYPKIGCVDNYLHEGALADDPPSKTVYAPSGRQLDSLGVHEHWNSVEKMQYSRNLGIGDGIELIQLHANE